MTTNLIIGGTGKTGRRVASRLQDRGLPVTSLSRPAFDWAEPTTWSAVEQPAAAAYLTYAPDLTFPGAPEALADVADRLARSGVRRIVLLSGRGEVAAQRAERLVAETAERHGAEWGVVACAFFMQNFDEGIFAEPLESGRFEFPGGAVAEPFVDLDDVADVAAGILAGEVPANQVYELTGPELLTFAEATATVATVTGRPIAYHEITIADMVADLVRRRPPCRGRGRPRSRVRRSPGRPQRAPRPRRAGGPGSGTAQLRRVRRARGRARCLGWSGGCVVTGVVTGVGQTLGEARPPSR